MRDEVLISHCLACLTTRPWLLFTKDKQQKKTNSSVASEVLISFIQGRCHSILQHDVIPSCLGFLFTPPFSLNNVDDGL